MSFLKKLAEAVLIAVGIVATFFLVQVAQEVVNDVIFAERMRIVRSEIRQDMADLGRQLREKDFRERYCAKHDCEKPGASDE
jgi:hypothetical protein